LASSGEYKCLHDSLQIPQFSWSVPHSTQVVPATFQQHISLSTLPSFIMKLTSAAAILSLAASTLAYPLYQRAYEQEDE
jgi:hypothetical protein